MAAALAAWALVRRGAPYAAIVPTVALGHWIVVERLIPIPSTESGRALAAIGGGFVLLGLSLVASVRFRRRFIVDPEPAHPTGEAAAPSSPAPATSS